MQIQGIGPFDGLDIEAPVLGKLLILRSDDGERQVGRDPIQIDPGVAKYVVRIAAGPGRQLRLRHECAEERIDPAQDEHREHARRNANHDQPHHCPQQPGQD
jgi:hypothetical protein